MPGQWRSDRDEQKEYGLDGLRRRVVFGSEPDCEQVRNEGDSTHSGESSGDIREEVARAFPVGLSLLALDCVLILPQQASVNENKRSRTGQRTHS